MHYSKEIMDRAEQLQNECHLHVKATLSKTSRNVSYNDASMVWIFSKIAELELKIYELSKNK